MLIGELTIAMITEPLHHNLLKMLFAPKLVTITLLATRPVPPEVECIAPVLVELLVCILVLVALRILVLVELLVVALRCLVVHQEPVLRCRMSPSPRFQTLKSMHT